MLAQARKALLGLLLAASLTTGEGFVELDHGHVEPDGWAGSYSSEGGLLQVERL
jgi:hypothetical protein